MVARNAAHEALVDDILLAHGSGPERTLWRHPTGRMQAKSGAWFSFGLKGSSDIIGLTSCCGRFLGIECKTGKAVQNKGQKRFQKMIEDHGGVYILARSTEIDWPPCPNCGRI